MRMKNESLEQVRISQTNIFRTLAGHILFVPFSFASPVVLTMVMFLTSCFWWPIEDHRNCDDDNFDEDDNLQVQLVNVGVEEDRNYTCIPYNKVRSPSS